MKTRIAYTLGVLAIGITTSVPVSGQTRNQSPSESQATEWQLSDARASDMAGDSAAAIRIFMGLARAGVAEAEYQVGMHLKNGEGFCRDDARAAEWLLKAGNQDYTDAQRELGVLFYTSPAFRDTPDHEGSAIAWLEAAAQKGDADAQFWLGRINSRAAATPEQFSSAVGWYEKAATKGRNDAATQLGRLYQGGLGVATNPVKAVFWYRKAAEADDAHGELELGRLYETGQGVPKDYVLAYKWYALSASNSTAINNEFFQARNAIAAKMTPKQIDAGKALVRAFRKVHPGEDWGDAVLPVPPVPRGNTCAPYPAN